MCTSTIFPCRLRFLLRLRWCLRSNVHCHNGIDLHHASGRCQRSVQFSQAHEPFHPRLDCHVLDLRLDLDSTAAIRLEPVHLGRVRHVVHVRLHLQGHLGSFIHRRSGDRRLSRSTAHHHHCVLVYSHQIISARPAFHLGKPQELLLSPSISAAGRTAVSAAHSPARQPVPTGLHAHPRLR